MTHVVPKPPRWYFRPSALCLLIGHDWRHEWYQTMGRGTVCDAAWGTCAWRCRRCDQRVGW